ncbi:MAG: dUTP diphosphatase [Bacilli bacterium]|nr:dUTP diphosphatase [Bacilli bacterium]
MEKLKKIYERNKELDHIFMKKYEEKEPLYFEKNCIEFLVEFGEFVNETKCFKYWSIKKPKMEDVYEELADCITMTLTMYYVLDLEIDTLVEHHKSKNILEVINHIYGQGSKLMTKINETLVKDILSNLFYLADLLELDKEEIYRVLTYKQDKVEERLNSDY